MVKYTMIQKAIYLCFMVLMMVIGAFAQTETNVEALLEFARIKKIEAEQQ